MIGIREPPTLNNRWYVSSVLDTIRITSEATKTLHPRDAEMTTHLVNLDALITRENFQGSAENNPNRGSPSDEIKLMDLEGPFYRLLKKPDFQRATNNWSPKIIAEFVRSFLDGDVIPACIMWRNPEHGEFFVIDGAHRMSALVAFVHDDYGDGKITKTFLNYTIPKEQEVFAAMTRALIEKEVGSFAQLKNVLYEEVLPRDITMRQRANNAFGFKIGVQWVHGDANNAERSFFRINNTAVAIDKTELQIIQARKKPNAIATRALVNAGIGHKYWAGFPENVGAEIELLAKEISTTLFTPILKDKQVKTLDLPIAGRAYSANAFRLVFDLINQVNGITPAMWEEKVEDSTRNPEGGTKRKRKATATNPKLGDDIDGSATVAFLKETRKAAMLISGNRKGSLGLHPIVYFYGRNGNFHPVAFLATIKFMMDLSENKRLFAFTKVRRDFEEYLVRHPDLVSELVHQYGSRKRPLDAVFTMYYTIFNQLRSGVASDDMITAALINEPKLVQLQTVIGKDAKGKRAKGKRRRKEFGTEEKSAAYIANSIDSPPRCGICGARIHIHGFNIDHDLPKSDGGTGDVRNAVTTHYYCNDGFKTKLRSIEASKKLLTTAVGADADEDDAADDTE